MKRIVLVLCSAAMIAMLLFPPWVLIYDIPANKFRSDLPSRGRVERPAGYHFLLEEYSREVASYVTIAGEETEAFVSRRIDWARLFVQLGIVLLATLLLYW